jgi:hypothetical protein
MAQVCSSPGDIGCGATGAGAAGGATGVGGTAAGCGTTGACGSAGAGGVFFLAGMDFSFRNNSEDVSLQPYA